jgi:hypothetical protein
VLTGIDVQFSAGQLPALSADELKALPPSLGKALEDLASVERLKAALGKKWPGKPDVARLERDLATYAPLGGPSEAARLQQALAAKATREGYAEAAWKLLSPDATLRDIVKEAPGDGASNKPPSSENFAGAVPEPPSGTSAAPRQSATEGLPPFEEEVEAKVEATARQTRQRTKRQVGDETEVASHQLHVLLQQVADYRRRAEQLARENAEDKKKDEPPPDDKPEEAVARALNRRLTPQDRILLQGMLNKGMKTPAIVAQFREMEATADK